MVEIRVCSRCSSAFTPKRQAQKYCSKACRVSDAVKRYRTKEAITSVSRAPLSRYMPSGGLLEPYKPVLEQSHAGEALLEFHADGYPVLPRCLDRRRKP